MAQTDASGAGDHAHYSLFAVYGVATAIAMFAGWLVWRLVMRRTYAARKAAALESQKSGARFRALAEISSDFFWEMDKDFRFTRFFGRDAETSKSRYVGKYRWDSASIDDTADAQKWADHRKVLESHQAFRNFEFEVKTDPPHWDSISGDPLFDKAGKFSGYLGSTSDITARKLAEQALQESEERLKLSLKSGNIGTFSWNIKDGTHYWDDRNHEIWGFEPGAYSGQIDADFLNNIHPEDSERVRNQLSQIMADGSEFEMAYRIVRPDGEIAHIQAAAILIRDNHGAPEKLIGVSHDITELTLNQQALAKRERDYSAMLDSSPIGVGIFDFVSGKMKFVNNRLPEIMGFSRDDIMNRTVGDYWVNLDDRDDFVADFKKNGRASKEVQLRKPDGTYFWCVLTWRTNPVFDDDVVFWLYDISDRQPAEPAVMRAEE